MFNFLRPNEKTINNYYNSTCHTLVISKNEKQDLCVSIDGNIIDNVELVSHESKVTVLLKDGTSFTFTDKLPKSFVSFATMDNDEYYKIRHLI